MAWRPPGTSIELQHAFAHATHRALTAVQQEYVCQIAARGWSLHIVARKNDGTEPEIVLGTFKNDVSYGVK